MKKNIIILMIALAGFMFAGMQSANAQVNYTVHIQWNDNNCSCDTVTLKECRVVLKDIVANETLDDSEWYTVTGTFDTYNSIAFIDYDAQDRYQLSVAIVYYNNGNKCCGGLRSVIYDGDDFLNPILFPIITMN